MVKIKHAIILGVGVKYVIIYLCTSFTRTLCTVDMQEIFAKLSAFCWTSQVTQVKNPCASAGNTGDVGFIPELRKKWRRKWHPTPVFLPGKSHGQRSLAGYSPWSHKEPDSFAALGIFSCVMHTVSCSMWDLVPEQGSNPWSLNWEFGVLATGPPGKSVSLK